MSIIYSSTRFSKIVQLIENTLSLFSFLTKQMYVPITIINPTFLMLEDCGLSNMTSEPESTCTRRENREKHRVEMEELNQQDNNEQQVHQFCRAIQPKFKAPFSKI